MLPSITCIARFSALYTNQPAHRTDVFPYSVTELVTAKDGILPVTSWYYYPYSETTSRIPSFLFNGHNYELDRVLFDKVLYH